MRTANGSLTAFAEWLMARSLRSLYGAGQNGKNEERGMMNDEWKTGDRDRAKTEWAKGRDEEWEMVK